MRIALLSLLVLSTFALGKDGDDDFDDWMNRPREKFEGGERVFESVKRELLTRYLKDGLSEDDLYRAAVDGMLAQIDPPLRSYNKLLSPSEHAELLQSLKGEVSGVGVILRFDSTSGRGEVLGTVPGSPAERAGLRRGDMVLTVDGATFKGRQLRDVVAAIRGPAGQKVSLGILHESAVNQVVLDRAKVSYEVVKLEFWPNDVAVLAIEAFGEGTPAAVRTALKKVAEARAKGLVIDLRGNEGGMLEKAIETLRLLLPRGASMTRLRHRGGKEEVRANSDEPVLKPLPTVVLVDNETRSSAELVAAALREGLKAPVIGTPTAGKWTAQELKILPNRFVLRYTVAAFLTPDGKSYEGEGLPVDVEVQEGKEEDSLPETAPQSERLSRDGPLRAALSFLRLR